MFRALAVNILRVLSLFQFQKSCSRSLGILPERCYSFKYNHATLYASHYGWLKSIFVKFYNLKSIDTHAYLMVIISALSTF